MRHRIAATAKLNSSIPPKYEALSKIFRLLEEEDIVDMTEKQMDNNTVIFTAAFDLDKFDAVCNEMEHRLSDEELIDVLSKSSCEKSVCEQAAKRIKELRKEIMQLSADAQILLDVQQVEDSPTKEDILKSIKCCMHYNCKGCYYEHKPCHDVGGCIEQITIELTQMIGGIKNDKS